MAGTLQLAGRYTEAEPLYREGLATQRKVYGSEHPLVATTLGNLALVQHELHNDHEAEQLYGKFVAIEGSDTAKPPLGGHFRPPGSPRLCKASSG